VQAAHNGFRAGLKDAGGALKTSEVYTGSFDDAQKAAEATRGLIAEGAKLIWTSGDGIGSGVAAAAANSGALTLGVTGEAGGLAKKVNVASVVLNLYPTYRDYVDDIAAAKLRAQVEALVQDLASGLGGALAGALPFGLFESASLRLQAHIAGAPAELFSIAPYLMTLAVLMLSSRGGQAPRELGAAEEA
jgi:basic membrane lipoprotein Med (substrate-binding protein (PBP1-ABC) superfamily)